MSRNRRDNISDLLFKQFLLEIFFVDDVVNHDETPPKFYTSQSHLGICVFNSVEKYLETKSRVISLKNKRGVLSKYLRDAINTMQYNVIFLRRQNFENNLNKC